MTHVTYIFILGRILVWLWQWLLINNPCELFVLAIWPIAQCVLFFWIKCCYAHGSGLGWWPCGPCFFVEQNIFMVRWYAMWTMCLVFFEHMRVSFLLGWTCIVCPLKIKLPPSTLSWVSRLMWGCTPWWTPKLGLINWWICVCLFLFPYFMQFNKNFSFDWILQVKAK